MEELKSVYEIGLSPLREALMKLTSVLVLEEHKGFRVAPVSKAQLLDITNMRKELEAMAIRQSIAEGDDSWESGMLTGPTQLPRGGTTRQWHERNAAPRALTRLRRYARRETPVHRRFGLRQESGKPDLVWQ
jgi:GntR family transcriptional regulator, carbon starvation induced regulator